MWRQSEHVALIGQTGSGKSTLAREMLKLRGFAIAIVTKPDPLLWPSAWKRVAKTADIDLAEASHFVLRPPYAMQQIEIARAMQAVWQQGGWTLYLDELYYIEQQLKLDDPVIQLLSQGRSNNITVVVGMQRPAWVTRFALSEPTHIFCGRLGDDRDKSTVKSIIGSEYLDAVMQVTGHDFVWLDKPANEMKVINKYNLAKTFGTTLVKTQSA